eukprot:gnl/TRDRNA2_/TRDRNA2_188007_c0_seq1.p1 gnl/TRDRNA2_/TRDRNA2_188007_c0~~gnl/TRDRNA2_/TRDRNA2_188007_c0_seq1.p1  ORF type:complete len:280 (-),score=54.23 gnl/TRDRNA2_/TRDRNA2_188007_c0_seq1:74-913(-)
MADEKEQMPPAEEQPPAEEAAPEMPPYVPTSVTMAWNNHFEAFGAQNLEQIMLDYDESSVVRLFNNSDESKNEFVGMQAIADMFAGLFADLSNLDTLDAPVIDVDEEFQQVFLVWKCPGCGYKTATDTFIFGPDFKIKRQNIVVTKGSVEPMKVAPVSSVPVLPQKMSYVAPAPVLSTYARSFPASAVSYGRPVGPMGLRSPVTYASSPAYGTSKFSYPTSSSFPTSSVTASYPSSYPTRYAGAASYLGGYKSLSSTMAPSRSSFMGSSSYTVGAAKKK